MQQTIATVNTSATVYVAMFLKVQVGAYELPKVAKEHETYSTCQVPTKYFSYKESKILLFEDWA